jgi:tetratricopeptide (TPR) repeat protein
MKNNYLIADTDELISKYLEQNTIVLFGSVYLIGIFIIQLFLPITAGDTDMWYHLSDGRYMWETGTIPDRYFGSFTMQSITWIDHFWAFQGLIYMIHEIAGYWGLLILRSLLVLAICFVIYKILTGSKQNQPINSFALLIVFGLYLILIDGRGYQLRPHLFSYLLIPTFIYILEYRKKYLFTLPFLAVVWVNFHGIEWVIGALICGSYVLEGIYKHLSRTSTDNDLTPKEMVIIALCLPALLLNPNGINLLLAPFLIPSHFSIYIKEMIPIQPDIFTTFSINALKVTPNTAFIALFFLSLYSLIWHGYRKRLKISHFIMLIGGLLLLTKGRRFIWEWSLLTLPLISFFLSSLKANETLYKRASLLKYAAFMFLLYPLFSIWDGLPNSNKYPFNPNSLPIEVSNFLDKSNSSGNLLSPPNLVGYYQWILHPEILFHSDMKGTPEIFAELMAGYRSEQGFRNILNKYEIDFVTVNIQQTGFKDIISKFPHFVPIFTDDIHALYANKNSQSRIIKDTNLDSLDPFSLGKGGNNPKGSIKNLERLKELSPNNRRILHALVYWQFKEKDYSNALKTAERYVTIHPDDPNSHFWLGNILENLNRPEEAIESFHKALANADTSSKKMITRHIGTSYYLMEDFENAYSAFSGSINPFLSHEHPEDLYQFAFSSVVVGDIDYASLLLDLVITTSPTDKADMINNAKVLKSRISNGEFDQIGVISWLESLIKPKT